MGGGELPIRDDASATAHGGHGLHGVTPSSGLGRQPGGHKRRRAFDPVPRDSDDHGRLVDTCLGV
eukprot:6157570-Lingulodinium_polyedra.AAC.1